MEEPGQEEQQWPNPCLLLDLPGPAWSSLWSFLTYNDRLKMLQLCSGVRERGLCCLRKVEFRRTGGLNPGPPPRPIESPLLQTLLRRPRPPSKLKFMDYSAAFKDDDWLSGMLHELAAGHARGGAGAGHPPWPGAAALKTLKLERVRITADAAALLPQAFPSITSLKLRQCHQDSAALLKALRTFAHLAHVIVDDPSHMDPAGLWSAAVAEAEAAGHLELLQAAAVPPVGSEQEEEEDGGYAYSSSGSEDDGSEAETASEQQEPSSSQEEDDTDDDEDAEEGPMEMETETREARECKAAAAVGYLLSSLAHLTSVELGLDQVLTAFGVMALGGLGSQLTVVGLCERDYPPTYRWPAGPQLVTTLQACSSLSSLELDFGNLTRYMYMECPGLELVLAACPGLASTLRSLSLPWLRVDQELLAVILEHLPALEHLCVKDFQLYESRAQAPCSWRSLRIASGTLDVCTLAHLPLHSLTQPIGLGDRATLALSVCMTPPPLSTLDDALANLARCSLSMSSARGLREVHVVPSTCDPNYSCPSLLRLLLFFPCAEKLSLDMRELGAEELACLSASRSFCSGVQELLLGCSRLHPGFLAPGLWDVFPQLHTLCFQKSATLDLPVADIVQCLAARPSSTKLVLRGLRLVAKGAKKELRDQLAALDGCNVWVMS